MATRYKMCLFSMMVRIVTNDVFDYSSLVRFQIRADFFLNAKALEANSRVGGLHKKELGMILIS